MDLTRVNNEHLALVLISTDDTGEEDWAVCSGIARWNGETLVLDRGRDRQLISIPPHTHDRIKPVPDDVRDILCGADFYLPLKVDPLPADADPGDYIQTDLKWPGDHAS